DDPSPMAPALSADERGDRSAEEPRRERPVEELELVVTRHERLAQREVDVLLPGQVHRAEPADGVDDAARPDLDPDLAQHAAEGDYVPDDRGSLHELLPSGRRARLLDEA